MMELRTENLVVGYDKHPLIKNVNLRDEIRRGSDIDRTKWSRKIYNIKTITKQLKILGGAVYIGDTSMSNMRDSEIARTLSMVMTERLQTELLSGRDVVASGRYPYTGKLVFYQRMTGQSR